MPIIDVLTGTVRIHGSCGGERNGDSSDAADALQTQQVHAGVPEHR